MYGELKTKIMLKTIQKKVENLRIKVYGGQSLEDNEKALSKLNR
jgi:hypothetical protein